MHVWGEYDDRENSIEASSRETALSATMRSLFE